MNDDSSRPALGTGLVLCAASVALAIAAFMLLPHCGGEHVMRCVWMTRATGGTAVLAAAAALFAALSRSAAFAAGAEAGVLLGGLLVSALSSFLIGPCPNPMMGCHMVTGPALVVAGAVLALFGALDMWRLTRRRT